MTTSLAAGPAATATPRPPRPLSAVAGAVGLWVCWTLATYLLEGRSTSYMRPGASQERILYLLIANFAIGAIGSALLLRRLIGSGVIESRRIGFGSMGRTAVAVLTGGLLGFTLLLAQGPPTLDPVVLLNGWAQVLVVSIAEVLVGWSVLGGTLEAALTPRLGRWSTPVAALGAAVLFGLYHFAHSPPFNTVAMVTLLSFVGVVTSAFFFVSRDVYGTIVFHNFFAAFGVLRALEQAGRLDAYTVLQPARVISAVVGVIALIAIHWLITARISPSSAPN